MAVAHDVATKTLLVCGYQSKTIMEHKNVTYDGQLRPIIVKSNIVPNAQVR